MSEASRARGARCSSLRSCSAGIPGWHRLDACGTTTRLGLEQPIDGLPHDGPGHDDALERMGGERNDIAVNTVAARDDQRRVRVSILVVASADACHANGR